MHLNYLEIRNFRGIDSLELPNLGNVTLITRGHSAGKTTVLDAVQTYAARGRKSVLAKILGERDELSGTDVDWSALFYDREPKCSSCFLIGPNDEEKRLTISVATLGSAVGHDLLNELDIDPEF